MLEWVREHQVILWTLVGLSAVTFVGSLIAIPFLVARIPADYFAHRRRHREAGHSRHPVAHTALIVGKNTLGVVFIAAGVAMLLLPGQGVLTMFIGVMLMDFPGKYRLERWLVGRRSIARALNWMRRRAGQPPLEPWTGREMDPATADEPQPPRPAGRTSS